MGCHFLLQGIFPTQGSNHVSCRWILYHCTTWEALYSYASFKKKLDHNFWCMGVLEGKSWQQWFLSSKLDTLSESHSSSVSYKYLPALDLALSLEHKFPRTPVKQNALFSLLYSSFNLQTFCVMIVIKEQIPDYVSLFVALLRGKESSYFDNLVIYLNVNW